MNTKTYTLNHSNSLSAELTRTKAELQELATTFGIVHELTVAKSQELDLVVNKYMIQKSLQKNSHRS